MRKKYNPVVEAKKNYIAYNNSNAYAKTDIPLHQPSGTKYLTPREVWSDFDPEAEPLWDEVISVGRYQILARSYGEAKLKVEISVFMPKLK